MLLQSFAKSYALRCHESTNHLYDGQPYRYHLEMVVDYINQYSYLESTSEYNLEFLIASGWCHDVIEDTRQTYNDVLKIIGTEATEIVYALTNEKGRTRKERANKKYYQGILETPGATFVKICDRLANVVYSKDTNSKMLDRYREEHVQFCDYLWIGSKYDPMFDKLGDLLNK